MTDYLEQVLDLAGTEEDREEEPEERETGRAAGLPAPPVRRAEAESAPEAEREGERASRAQSGSPEALEEGPRPEDTAIWLERAAARAARIGAAPAPVGESGTVKTGTGQDPVGRGEPGDGERPSPASSRSRAGRALLERTRRLHRAADFPPAPGREKAPVVELRRSAERGETLTAEELDRAVQRDARRYDGGFSLY